MILSSEMLEELSRKTFKKQKIDENLKKDYENLKREYNNIKLENKRIIANAAERLRILSERKSKINLSLKNENNRLNSELIILRNKLNENEKLLQEKNCPVPASVAAEHREISSNGSNNQQLELELNNSMTKLNENENKFRFLENSLEKLKNENLFLKIEKDKALSYAYHYVKKLKDFENTLIKERLNQNKGLNFFTLLSYLTKKIIIILFNRDITY
jgi:hypothetical protein